MSEERNGADISAKIAGQEINVKNVKSLNTILTLATLLVGVGMATLLWTHADGADKTSQALLREIQQSNKANLDAQKNIAYHSCRQSCLLEQPQDKRDGAICERTCATLKP
jgi:hypothetical protein